MCCSVLMRSPLHICSRGGSFLLPLIGISLVSPRIGNSFVLPLTSLRCWFTTACSFSRLSCRVTLNTRSPMKKLPRAPIRALNCYSRQTWMLCSVVEKTSNFWIRSLIFSWLICRLWIEDILCLRALPEATSLPQDWTRVCFFGFAPPHNILK